MQVTQTPEEIAIRYVPVREWLVFGGLVAVVGVWFLWALYSLFGEGNVLSGLPFNWARFVSPLIAGAVFSLMFYGLARVPLVTVTVSRKTGSADAHFRRIYGRRTERYYFPQIGYFKSYRGAGGFYHLALVLANFKEVDLKTVVGKEKGDAAKLVKKLNKFMKPPPPPKTSQKSRAK